MRTPINGTAAFLSVLTATVIHYCAYSASFSSGDLSTRLEIFALGVVVPSVLMAYSALRAKAPIIVNSLFGLGLGMFATLAGGFLFSYAGPSDVDYYEDLAGLTVIFVLPFATAGGLLSLLTWMYASPQE